MSYQTKGNFWIALDSETKKVVGCIGLVSLTNDNVALKKMFVLPTYRKDGLGRKLVETFLDYCQEKRKKFVYLGTNSAFELVQRFYQKLGFQEISSAELPQDFLLLEVSDRHYVHCMFKKIEKRLPIGSFLNFNNEYFLQPSRCKGQL